MHRRAFLLGSSLAPLLPLGAQAQPARGGLRISDIKTFVVGLPTRNLVFVKVETEQGIHGIGEPYSCGPDEATVAVIQDFKRWLVGQDPRNIEYLWAMMYNGTRFPPGPTILAAISGIEHALWDIKGKALGVPVWQLLGGAVRDRVRVYQNPGGRSPEDMAERAVALIEKYGYTALKLGPHPPGSERMPWNAVVRGAAEHELPGLPRVIRAIAGDEEARALDEQLDRSRLS